MTRIREEEVRKMRTTHQFYPHSAHTHTHLVRKDHPQTHTHALPKLLFRTILHEKFSKKTKTTSGKIKNVKQTENKTDILYIYEGRDERTTTRQWRACNWPPTRCPAATAAVAASPYSQYTRQTSSYHHNGNHLTFLLLIYLRERNVCLNVNTESWFSVTTVHSIHHWCKDT